MTVTQSVRTTAKKKLTDLLAERLGDVKVAYGYDARDATGEMVWTDDISDGEVVIAHLGGTRKQRDDRFTITVYCAASAPGKTIEEQEQRVEELYGALEDVLADYPTLDRLPGVVHAIQKGPCIGPETDPTTEGFASLMVASVEVLSRLQ